MGLSSELRGRITGLVDVGMSFAAAGRVIGCDEKMVVLWVNRNRITGNLKDLPRPTTQRRACLWIFLGVNWDTQQYCRTF